MDQSILQLHDKTTLKNLAFEKGLSRRGFNGRNVSRMRKQDFIDFLLSTESATEGGSLEDDIISMFQELMVDDFQHPLIHIMGALSGIQTLHLRSSGGDIRIFERSNSIDTEITEKKEERIPNEEDESVPKFEFQDIVNTSHTSECDCEVCQKNNKLIEENLKVAQNIQDLETKITCVVCQSNVRNIIFKPCNHLATCITCSKHPLLKKCPLCRKVFDDTTRVFC
ncbi:hypothetical protein WIV_gp032 [Wiseana iridescent virus]|uniref:RING-type domain-containing protein n=1 Tax=Wiseana iridescent virus TaxID=68347 RepID=G0T558_IRV9|nr:hypothetical protein WIV_gp032 [Wiseana iridescent virus]ADO00375.1 hypothetical protein [Wiseana iridescent virus]